MKKRKIASGYKYFIFSILGLIIIFIVLVGLGRIPLGHDGINYFQYAGINFELIKTNGDSLPVIEQLKHPDYITQFDAILEITRWNKNKAEIDALLGYIKSPETHKNMKEMAVWALGEMKEESALNLLVALRNKSNLDKYEINKAIKKINNEYGWKERIKNQFE